MNKVKEIEVWIEGIYKGIEMSNDKLKEWDLKIYIPTKEKLIKMYDERMAKKQLIGGKRK